MGAGSKETAVGSGGRPGRFLAAAGLPLAAVLALGGQFVLGPGGGAYRRLVPGVFLLVLAVALAVLTLLRRRVEASGADERGARRIPPGLEWSIVAVLVLGGLYLRLYRIDIVPWGLNNDEAINALEARDILDGRPFATLTERGLNRETMFHYLAAAAYRSAGIEINLLQAMPAVFGLNPRYVADPLMGLVFPLRSVAIGAGTLTLLALYLFARDRFGRPAAFLATAFLACSPWHLLYSRAGLRAILAPLFAVGAVAFFLRALATRRLRDHLAWGAVAGLGLWTYTSFRAVPLAIGAFLLLRFVDARHGRTRALIAGVLLAIGPCLFLASPAWLRWPLAGLYGLGIAAAVFAWAREAWRQDRPVLAGVGAAAAILAGLMALSPVGPLGYLTRGAYATVKPKTNFALNLLASFGMPHYFPQRYAVIESDDFISDGVSAVYGLIGLPPETVVVAALSALGIVYGAWRALRRRDAACGLLVLCFLALVLTVGPAGPSLTRLLPNVPWLCLFAALFAGRVFEDLADLRRPLSAWAAALVMAPLVAWSGVAGYGAYFLRAGTSAQAMQHFGAPQTIMGMFVRSLPPDRVIYVLHTRRVDTLQYLIGDRPNIHLASDPTTLDLDGIIKMPRTATFVIEFARPFAETLRYLIMRYPLGDATQIADARLDPDKIIFYTFTLWKDESGQPVPAPDAFTGAPPAGLPPGVTPPGPAAPGAPPIPGDVPPLVRPEEGPPGGRP